MSTFVEPVPSREVGEGVKEQLQNIRARYPRAGVRLVGPDPGASPWRVEVEVEGEDPEAVKQACIDLLGD